MRPSQGMATRLHSISLVLALVACSDPTKAKAPTGTAGSAGAAAPPLVVPAPPEGALRRVSGTRFVLPTNITFLAVPANRSLVAAGSDQIIGANVDYPELPDGSVLTLGRDDEQVSLRWSDRNGRELRHIDLEAPDIYPRMRLALSGDGRRIAICQGAVQVLDAMTGKLVAEGYDWNVRDLALDRSGGLLGIAGPNVLQIKSIGGRDPELPGFSAHATAIAITPAGHRLIVGGTKGEVVVVDLQQPAAQPVEHVGHVGPVRAIAIDPDGKSFATGGDDGTIVIWPLR